MRINKYIAHAGVASRRKAEELIKEGRVTLNGKTVTELATIVKNGDIIRANGSIPGYNCCFIANYKTKKMVMLFSNNIDYLTLKAASDDLLHNYMGA